MQAAMGSAAPLPRCHRLCGCVLATFLSATGRRPSQRLAAALLHAPARHPYGRREKASSRSAHTWRGALRPSSSSGRRVEQARDCDACLPRRSYLHVLLKRLQSKNTVKNTVLGGPETAKHCVTKHGSRNRSAQFAKDRQSMAQGTEVRSLLRTSRWAVLEEGQ